MKEDKTYSDFYDFDSGFYAPNEEYQGVLESYAPNGQLLFRGEFEKGEKRIGQHISFWDNGNLKEVSYWVDGWIHGTQLWFDEDGSLSVERFFGENGGRHRRWIERHYRHFRNCEDESGKVWWIELYEDDSLQAEWIDDDSRKLSEDGDLDTTIRRAVKKYFPEWDLD